MSTVTVTGIIDGDSIRVDNCMNVRVANVNVPSSGPTAKLAIQYIVRYWLGEKVVLKNDPNQGDKVVHGDEHVKQVIRVRDGVSLGVELLQYGQKLLF